MKQDTNFYCVDKDDVWANVSKINELLTPDDEGKSLLASSDRHFCLGMMRVMEYVISNGESTIDLSGINMKVKK
jgi:hypothetical protein